MISPERRRKSVPLKAQLHAALYQLGLEPHEAELDHDPALKRRDWDEQAKDTIPPANDPKFLIWRPREAHARKTFGPGGEKRITTYGSDVFEIAKERRLTEQQEQFRSRLLTPVPKEERRSKRWPKRSFQKKRQSHHV
jgi:hypothetical protein